MRKYFSILVLLFLCYNLNGQQQILFSQYNIHKFALNPATAGLQGCGEFTLGRRIQWKGITGAPSSNYAAYNARIGKVNLYPKNFHAWGFTVLNEKIGIIQTNYIRGAYAFNMKLNQKYRIAFGLFVGIQQNQLDYGDIRSSNKGGDPALYSKDNTAFAYPDIGQGTFIYSKNFYAGLSILQLYPAPLNYQGTEKYTMEPSFHLTSGTRIKGSSIDFIPSTMVAFSSGVLPTFDLTFNAEYENIFLLGAGTRFFNSVYGNVQLQIARKIRLAYTYEYATTPINNIAGVTHEFGIRITTCKSEKNEDEFFCPAYK